MAWESPLDAMLHPEGTWKSDFIDVCEWVYLGIFTFELLTKVLAYGFLWHPEAYLRDAWCQLDFVVVTLACWLVDTASIYPAMVAPAKQPVAPPACSYGRIPHQRASPGRSRSLLEARRRGRARPTQAAHGGALQAAHGGARLLFTPPGVGAHPLPCHGQLLGHPLLPRAPAAARAQADARHAQAGGRRVLQAPSRSQPALRPAWPPPRPPSAQPALLASVLLAAGLGLGLRAARGSRQERMGRTGRTGRREGRGAAVGPARDRRRLGAARGTQVSCVLKSIPKLSNVAMLCAFCFLVFGIVRVARSNLPSPRLQPYAPRPQPTHEPLQPCARRRASRSSRAVSTTAAPSRGRQRTAGSFAASTGPRIRAPRLRRARSARTSPTTGSTGR